MTISLSTDTSKKPLSRFAIIERATRRTLQVQRSFEKVEAECRQIGREAPWYPNEPLVQVILTLADGLIDYLEWPRDQWAQDSGLLRFFTGRTKDLLHMNFDLSVGGVTMKSSIGACQFPTGGHVVHWDEKEISKVLLGSPDTLTELFEKIAQKIATAATETARGNR
jgi:hypothetical protein